MPGPSNLYGVSNPVTGPVQIAATVDTVCNPGAMTTVASSGPFVAISGGVYYPFIVGSVLMQSGATPPVGITIGITVNSGSTFQTIGYDYRLFAANVEYSIPCALFGPSSAILWQGAGSTVQLQVYPFTNAVTVRQVGTFFTLQLFRAPDQ